ncbi:hypothetical protein [Archangium violaceum]|uniref:hypothetical protein n=1 Tax=Archangium violaceum TaxID=83451 RepID=UPI0036DAE516
MYRRPALVPVCALLSVSLLLGCGGVEAVSTGPEELLGTGESALCSGLSVTTLTLSGASTYQGEMAASGSWAVSGGANAIRLEYYIGGTLYSSEERTGTSGTWYFSQAGIACGTRTLLVKAWPMVIDSNGSRTTCWAATKSTSQAITEACPGGHWEFAGTESCADLFMRTCYQANPSPACPTNPQGVSCSPLGEMCWRVRSASIVDQYYCQ